MNKLNKIKIRENFRFKVFQRDNWKCLFCSESIWKLKIENSLKVTKIDNVELIGVHLDAHHIMDRNYFTNGGYVAENGITLCEKHHLMAEKYHMTNAQEWEEGMHPDDLYKKINSSFEQAIKADQNEIN